MAALNTKTVHVKQFLSSFILCVPSVHVPKFVSVHRLKFLML